ALRRAAARLVDRSPGPKGATGAVSPDSPDGTDGADGSAPGGLGAGARNPADGHDVVAVDVGARTLLVSLSDIGWVESAGDYVRLHLRDGGNHLLRSPMAALEEQWADRGFVRIHRGYLVSLADITEIRTDGAHTAVFVGDQELPVSRRHVHDLRDRLVRHARPSGR
ncbi:MAG: LytR/AlgR family response regulator transcription factor, partial [Acidimicrobiales bacterium]